MTYENPTQAISAAISSAGGCSALAAKLNVTKGLVWQWKKGRKRVSAEHLPRIEAFTGVMGIDLRPDIYPGHEPAPSPKPKRRRAAPEAAGVAV